MLWTLRQEYAQFSPLRGEQVGKRGGDEILELGFQFSVFGFQIPVFER